MHMTQCPSQSYFVLMQMSLTRMLCVAVCSFAHRTKLNLTPADVQAKRELVEHYIEGLYWVLQYYHK